MEENKVIIWDEGREEQFKQLEKENIWFEKKYGPYIEKRGLSNWRNLFRKPTIYEWTILFMLFMAFFIAWAYNKDVESCRNTLNNINSICLKYCNEASLSNYTNYVEYEPVNFSNLIFKEESAIPESGD